MFRNSSHKGNRGQKFIAQNRVPRVQIEYDIEMYGSETKVELPFVMGVMADFAGKSNISIADLSEREFLEIKPLAKLPLIL